MASSKTISPQLRLRVFAGPNGSGKSTIVNEVKNARQDGKPIDFGYYINADDITRALKEGKFSFNKFRIKVTDKKLSEFAKSIRFIRPSVYSAGI